jgi:hypothetical protein
MRKALFAVAATTATLAAVAATVPAQAGTTHHAQKGIAIQYKTVAKGLHGPRQVIFAHGAMYVAEAGKGGHGACIAGGEGPSCFGWTGSVTRVRHGHQQRVLNKLASLSNQADQSAPIGPSGLGFVGKHTLVVSMGLGGAPKERKKVPARAQKQLGHVLAFDLRKKKSKPASLGDLAAYEAKANPINEANSDPTGLLKVGSAWMVTDSGGNDLVTVNKHGKVKKVAVFKNRAVPGGTPGQTYESVPTDVVKGPDGAFYVSELTGFPFIPGQARIWRVKPGHKPTVYADGLTNVTGMAWSGKKLYAVQLADGGILAGPPGSLVQVFPHGQPAVTIAPGLFFPYGVAIHKGSAYVSTGAVESTGGTVLKIPLDVVAGKH